MAWHGGFHLGQHLVAEELVRAHEAERRAHDRRLAHTRNWKLKHKSARRKSLPGRMMRLIRGGGD
jgi:hypothetical protein